MLADFGIGLAIGIGGIVTCAGLYILAALIGWVNSGSH